MIRAGRRRRAIARGGDRPQYTRAQLDTAILRAAKTATTLERHRVLALLGVSVTAIRRGSIPRPLRDD